MLDAQLLGVAQERIALPFVSMLARGAGTLFEDRRGDARVCKSPGERLGVVELCTSLVGLVVVQVGRRQPRVRSG